MCVTYRWQRPGRLILVLLQAHLVLGCLAVDRVVEVQRAHRLAEETSQQHDTHLYNVDATTDCRSDTSVPYLNPLTTNVAIMGTAIKHRVPDRVKPSFVVFDIRAL